MNLVAKEYIAAQVDEPGGVLVLSKFAGAAEELDGAFEINPYDPESVGRRRCGEALLMSAEERRTGCGGCVGSLRTIYDWMGEIFQVWGAVARGDHAPLSAADGWKRTR
jgi:trehalose-6-phosphate synthase